MGLLKKQHNHQGLRLVFYKEGSQVENFNLDKNKLLIGSYDGCDIILKDKHVSHYHAIIFINEDGGKFLDLESINGIVLNGNRVKESFFGIGDIIKIGGYELHVEEYIAESDCKNLDQDKVEYHTSVESYIPTQKSNADLVLVDGEFCDIVFPDNSNSQINEVPLTHDSIDFTEYVDTSEKKNFYPIFKKDESYSIQVTILSNGNILSIDYFPMNDGTIFISNKKSNKKTIKLETLNSTIKLPFIDIKGNDVEIYPVKEFNVSELNAGRNDLSTNENFRLNRDDVISFYSEGLQILIQLVDAPPKIKKVPFFDFDKQMGQKSGIIFGIYISLWLILTFIINIEEIKKPPVKKIAVVYRKAIRSEVNSEQKSNGERTSNPQNKGVVKNSKPKDVIKQAKQGPKKPSKQKATAKKRTASATKTKNIKKIKTYNFKMAKNLSSMLNSSTNVKNIKINQNAKVISSEGFSNSVSDNTNLKSRKMGSVGNLGSSLKGKFNATSGAQGLGSKKGIDTTYVDPKTVVLGSMDPNLIRKILQEYLPQFQHCYQQELMRNDAVKGVVRLNFRINKTGLVSKVNLQAKRAKFSSRGVGCMKQVMNMIKFPRPKGGGVVDVTQPLNFFSERISGR